MFWSLGRWNYLGISSQHYVLSTVWYCMFAVSSGCFILHPSSCLLYSLPTEGLKDSCTQNKLKAGHTQILIVSVPQWFLLTEDVFSSSLAPSVLRSPWVWWLVSCRTWSSSFSLTEPLLTPPPFCIGVCVHEEFIGRPALRGHMHLAGCWGDCCSRVGEGSQTKWELLAVCYSSKASNIINRWPFSFLFLWGHHNVYNDL